METNKQNTMISSLIILLLVVQVFLSALIIKRLNDNDQTLSDINQRVALVAGPQQPEVPLYVEGVSVDDDPWLGTKDAPITIVEFADYECPFCAEASGIVEQLLLEYEGQIFFVYRDFPLERLHVNAFRAAEAANCAGEQNKYWEMHDLLFANQSRLDEENLRAYAAESDLNEEQFNECQATHKYEDEINHDISDAEIYQVNSVPTFFVNGNRVQGSSYENLRQVIELELGSHEEGG